MHTRLWITLVIILAIAGVSGWIDQPKPFKIGKAEIKIHEGLDLQGGTHLVYALDTSGVKPEDIASAHRSVVEVIRRRIDAFGVGEPIIQQGQVGDTRTVLVELPGFTDTTQAKNLIGKTAQLTFWEPDPTNSGTANPPTIGPGWKKTELNGSHLTRADFDFNSGSSATSSTEPIINITFTDEGAKLFEDITGRNVQQRVAIVLDDQIISAPTVQQKISGGKAIINGLGTTQAARELSIELNAGALPVPIHAIEERTIGATLGSESVRRSLIAGIFGLIMIAIFMIALYRLPGLLAVIALAIYTLIVFALFKLIPITLSLAGIAGFVLSIGMAVDANILIFERMREERQAGRNIKTAIDEGFRRAWNSVRDSNVSSLITASILFYFGTGLIRGFALTLAIGILISMFTAVTVTRTFLKLVLNRNPESAR